MTGKTTVAFQIIWKIWHQRWNKAGEGFILTKLGKPDYYYFKNWRIKLKGNSVLDYFNTHTIIEFNLCKYTTEEFILVLKICHMEEGNIHEIAELPKTSIQEPTTPFRGIR